MTDNSTYSESDVGPVDGSTVAAPAPTSTSPVDYTEANVLPLPTPVTTIGNQGTPDSKLQMAVGAVGDTLASYGKSATDALVDTYNYIPKANVGLIHTDQDIINYFKNFNAQHQTVPEHPMSPEEMQAAKITNVGFNSPLDYLFGTATDPLTVPKTYVKDSLSSKDIGLDPVKYLTTKSTLPTIVKTLAYPQESATRAYAKIQETAKLVNIVNNPAQYSPDIVQKAQAEIDATKKEANISFANKVADGFKGLVQHPLLAAQSFLDPAFLLMGEFKLGDMAVGPDLASSVKAEKAARTIAQEAEKFKSQVSALRVANKAAVLEKAQKYVDIYTGVAERAAANAKRLRLVKNAGNLAGHTISGAGINAGSTALQQNLDEGNVRPVDVAASGATGAIFGGTIGALGLGGEGEIPKTHADTVDGTPSVKGPVTAREPGQPLPSTTLIDATKVVPYYGGVDAEGNVIHISKDTPTHIEMKGKEGNTVNVPVRQTVAYHESVEHPLMHLTGPVSDAQLQLIKDRMGPYAHFEPGVEAKLREGKGLSYSEAHDIATRSENHLVEQMFGVDHNVYQDALKPHIAKVAKDSAKATAEDIPANLDTKPYDNMGHPEQLHGQGNRPAQDAGQPGAGSLDEKSVGPINPRTVGAAALTLGAAGYGAYQAGPGHRQEGIFKGLFGGMTMFGHQAIFAGALSRDFNPIMARAAEAMEKAGRTSEQINLATGYHRAVGGKWLHEIDDSGMRIKPHNDPIWKQAEISSVPLKDVMDHSEFARNYPKLMDSVKVRVEQGKPGAYYDPATGNITLSDPGELERLAIHYKEPSLRPRSVLAHELMHVVQHVEGLPKGDNVAGHILQLNEEANNLSNHAIYLENLIEEERQKGSPDQVKIKNYQESLDRIDKQLSNDYSTDAIKKEARRRYNASAGESQAVNVQERLNYDKRTRRDLAPHTTTQVAFPDQRVEYNREQSPHIQSHDLPISDHLQKTGEMDDEGKLSGMTLPEDRLPNEPEVLAKAAQNDQGAIAKLYKQYMPRLIRNARGLMRAAGPRLGMDAEDLAMHVFHKAIMHLKAGNFNGDSSFYTWMHTILRNTGLNEIERAGRTVPTESIHGATHDPYGAPVSNLTETARNVTSDVGTPEEHMIARQTSNMVQHAISKLPSDIREAVKAYEMEGKSYEEIAKEQGVPIGTVRSRLNRGRDMIEESIKRGHGANFRKQGGFATVDQMKRAALLGLGAFAGYTLGGQDHHWKDAFYGALAGIGAGAITLKGITRVVRDVRGADTLPRASSTLDRLEGNLNKLSRHTDAIQAQMKALQGANSLGIAHALEGDTSVKLTPEQEKVKEIASTLYAHIRDMAKAAGMSMQELENYTTHLFKPTEANKAIIDAFNKQQSTPLSKSSPFTKTRKLRMSLAEAISKGMELKHDNFADTFAEYYKSMLGAIHTKVAIDALRAATDLEKRPLVVRSTMAPHGYEVINHLALRGLSVHPAIAAEMSHMFDVHTPTHLGAAYQFVNSALKRIAFIGSFFHGQTLADVQMGMSINPYKNVQTTLKSVMGSTEFQKAVKNPQPGDFVDKLIEQGLSIPSNSTAFTEDIGKNMSEGFKFMESQLNALFPGLGNLPRAAAALDHLNTWIIFNRIGGGLMGEGSHIMFNKLKANWIKEIEKDPTKVMPSDEELRRRAVAMTSKSFGSLNWRRMANEVHNKYIRAFLMSTFSPAGRRAIQGIMLAPEWLTSTTLHWTKALFGKGEGSPAHPLNDVDLHRSWLLKSLFYSTLFGNALNYMFSGHSMMENKDKFMIDLGDGQKTPWMKELSDFPRLVMDPAQEILNKLSPGVRLIGQQLTGKQYLSAKGYAPSLKTVGARVQNAVETASPFSMSQNNTGGIEADISSMLGHPIYGMKPKDKMQVLMQRRQEAIKEKMAKLQRNQ